MDGKMTEELLLKFPAVLQSKLRSGDIVLPEEVEWQYESIHVYRCIFMNTKQQSDDITRDDFKSYAELGKKPKRGQKFDTSAPDYYGVSVFITEAALANRMHLPRNGVKVAEGDVYQEGGPRLIKEEHICWWLFEDADVSGFDYVREVKK